MRKIVGLQLVAFCWCCVTAAQQPLEQRMEDSVYGWAKVYHYGAKSYTAQDANGRHFLPQHKAWVDSFVNWIQASYIPRGGIGDVKRKLVSPYLEDGSRKSLPPAYGAWAFLWTMFVNEKGQHEIIRETEIPFGINANEVNGQAIDFLCSEKQYYFMRPGSAEERFSFADPSLRDKYDITRLPQLKPFITFYTTSSLYDRNARLLDAVLLSRNSRMPFLMVTKGEYLSQLADALERKYQQEKAYAEHQWPEGRARNEALQEALQRKNLRMAKLNSWKQKYANRLGENAELFMEQPDLYFENYADIFEGNGTSLARYPVYKLDKEMAAACTGEKPQWIIIAWSWDHDDPKQVYMHESIIRNLNFQYIHDFFFDPEKVKGKPYKPLNDPLPPKAPQLLTGSALYRQMKQDPSVLFFDDFSTTAAGNKPWHWYSRISTGGLHALVKDIPGDPAKGLWIRGNQVLPWDQPKQWPEAFSLSFDLQVPQGFEWGAKALELVLDNQKEKNGDVQSLVLRFRPGFDGRAGEYSLLLSPGWIQQEPQRTGELQAFSNTNILCRIQAELRRKGNNLSLWINNKMVTQWMDVLKPGFNPSRFYFRQASAEKENNTFYLGKVLIRKLQG